LRTGKGELAAALSDLVELKGIGPATASAILAAGLPEVPFMSDELLLVSQMPTALESLSESPMLKHAANAVIGMHFATSVSIVLIARTCQDSAFMPPTPSAKTVA
jgi:Helix-hairpin-helix motif